MAAAAKGSEFAAQTAALKKNAALKDDLKILQEERHNAAGDFPVKNNTYFSKGWVTDVEKNTRKKMHQKYSHRPQSAPYAVSLSPLQLYFPDKAMRSPESEDITVFSQDSDDAVIVITLERQPSYRLPLERLTLKRNKYETLGCYRVSARSSPVPTGNERQSAQEPETMNMMQDSSCSTANVTDLVEAQPNTQEIQDVMVTLDVGERAVKSAAVEVITVLPKLLEREECTVQTIDTVELEPHTVEVVALFSQQLEREKSPVHRIHAAVAEGETKVVPPDTLRSFHSEYILAERSLLRERYCLEAVHGVVEEVLGTYQKCPPGGLEESDKPQNLAMEVVPARPLAPSWYTRPLKLGLQSNLSAKRSKTVQYTELGDAVVRSAWSGSC